jgi:hypothetical protein
MNPVFNLNSLDPWNEAALKELAADHPLETLFAVLRGIEFLKQSGIVPDSSLRSALTHLPNHSGETLDDKAGAVGQQMMLALVTRQESQSSSRRESRVHAQSVLDYVMRHNSFFQRWEEFRSARPARDPEDWETCAVEGLQPSDHDYAVAMREFGQMLGDMISNRQSISSHLAPCLMHSHELARSERALQLLAWIDAVEREALG